MRTPFASSSYFSSHFITVTDVLVRRISHQTHILCHCVVQPQNCSALVYTCASMREHASVVQVLLQHHARVDIHCQVIKVVRHVWTIHHVLVR